MGIQAGSRTNVFASLCWPITDNAKPLWLENDDPTPRLYQRNGLAEGVGTHYIGKVNHPGIPFDTIFRAGVDILIPSGTFNMASDNKRLLHLIDFHDIVDKKEKGSFSPLTTNLNRTKTGMVYWELKYGGDSEEFTKPLEEDCRNVVRLSPEKGPLYTDPDKFGNRGGVHWQQCPMLEEEKWYSLEYHGRFSRDGKGFLDFSINGRSLWTVGGLTFGFPTAKSDLACKAPYTGVYDREPRLTAYHAKRLRVEFV